MHFVYNEGMDYVEALQKYRSENTGSEDDTTYPLFVYRRSVLRHPEDGAGRRGASHHTIKTDSNELFRIVQAEFDIEFMISDPRASSIEELEISHLGNEGISSIKEFSYTLPGLDTWTYYLNHSDLEEKSITLEDNFHKILRGKVTVRGFYFIAKGTSKRITQICANVRDLSTSINYDTFNIQV